MKVSNHLVAIIFNALSVSMTFAQNDARLDAPGNLEARLTDKAVPKSVSLKPVPSNVLDADQQLSIYYDLAPIRAALNEQIRSSVRGEILDHDFTLMNKIVFRMTARGPDSTKVFSLKGTDLDIRYEVPVDISTNIERGFFFQKAVQRGTLKVNLLSELAFSDKGYAYRTKVYVVKLETEEKIGPYNVSNSKLSFASNADTAEKISAILKDRIDTHKNLIEFIEACNQANSKSFSYNVKKFSVLDFQSEDGEKLSASFTLRAHFNFSSPGMPPLSPEGVKPETIETSVSPVVLPFTLNQFNTDTNNKLALSPLQLQDHKPLNFSASRVVLRDSKVVGIEVSFRSGRSKGEILLLGNMTFDSKSGEIYFASLHTDPGSKERLKEYATWLDVSQLEAHLQNIMRTTVPNYQSPDLTGNRIVFEEQQPNYTIRTTDNLGNLVALRIGKLNFLPR